MKAFGVTLNAQPSSLSKVSDSMTQLMKCGEKFDQQVALGVHPVRSMSGSVYFFCLTTEVKSQLHICFWLNQLLIYIYIYSYIF